MTQTTRDVLLDIVKHTAGLGTISSLKITGDDNDTVLDAIDDDKTVILKARFHEPVSDFHGEFGMGNLGLLSSLTKLSNYSDNNSTVKVVKEDRNGVTVPTTLLFKDDAGSKDQYRFMSKEIIDQTMKVATFKGVNWDIVITPTMSSVAQLSEVASIYAGIDPAFAVKSEGGDLIFEVGSAEGGILGRRVFAKNVDGQMNSVWSWPLTTFLNIVKLGMDGVCVIQFSDQGACQITIDSGIGLYEYILPAISR